MLIIVPVVNILKMDAIACLFVLPINTTKMANAKVVIEIAIVVALVLPVLLVKVVVTLVVEL